VAGNTYTFGRDELAARRMELLDEVFGPAGERVLGDLAGDRQGWGTVLDLGCGPGLTTSRLKDVLRPHRLVGLDVAETFLRLARERVPTATFLAHDLNQLPYPASPADLIYARYVLSHLPEPRLHVAEWRSQLAEGGVLVIEENHSIRAWEPVFDHYLRCAAEVMGGAGGDLYVGRALSGAGALIDRVAEISPPTRLTARMFRLNLRSWSRHAGPERAGEIEEIDRRLAALESSTGQGGIVWFLRQVALPPGG
jgi:trans-aconitate 2-methyltransferase